MHCHPPAVDITAVDRSQDRHGYVHVDAVAHTIRSAACASAAAVVRLNLRPPFPDGTDVTKRRLSQSNKNA